MTMVKFQVSSVLICNIHTSLKLQLIKYLCTYQCHACGGRGVGRDRAWGGDLIVLVGPGVGHLTDLVLPGEGIFESFDIFDSRLRWKRLRPNILYVSHFHASRMCHMVWKDRDIFEANWELAKAEWISLFCLQILFVLACFWSIEPLKILWYQSKRT